jgi:hypothetical protein
MQRIQFYVLLIGLFLSGQLYLSKCAAQAFEGEIIFTKLTAKDTAYYSYKIKGSKLRIEELDKHLKMLNYMLIDVSKPSVLAVNPKRKLYVEMSTYSRLDYRDTTEFVIYKTENYKRIKGYKCFQWRVRNKKQNTEVAYWVSNDFHISFANFLKLMNNDENCSVYYLNIPNTDGFFPLLAVERTVLREWKSSLEVMKIEKKNLSTALFKIPDNYKMFRKN